MLDSVKIARRQSEIRQALAELVGKDKPTEDETRSMSDMDQEYRTNETRYRAALTAEDQERREAGADLETRSDREWSDLVGRFELRQVAFALDEGRALNGATKEIVEELRNAGGYQGIPVPFAALETRAGETVAADVPNPKTIRPIIDRIFPGSVAERLGVQRINITSGELAFPVATAGAIFGWQTNELANVGAASEYQTAERSLNPDHTGGAQMVISRKALNVLARCWPGCSCQIRRSSAPMRFASSARATNRPVPIWRWDMRARPAGPAYVRWCPAPAFSTHPPPCSPRSASMRRFLP